jgi:hypothetical protein
MNSNMLSALLGPLACQASQWISEAIHAADELMDPMSLLQVRAEERRVAHHVDPPSECISPSSDYKVCSMWANPTGQKVNMEYGVEAGVYNVLESNDGSIRVQAFMCEAGNAATNIQGLAIQIGKDKASFLRGHAAFQESNDAVLGAWNITVNGERVNYHSLPRGFGAGLWMLQEGEDGQAGFSWPYSWPDGLPLCLGDAERRVSLHAGLAHDGHFMPALHVEMNSKDVKDAGLCGTNAEDSLLSWDDAIFASVDVAQLCTACGLQKGPRGCRPPAKSLTLLQGTSRTPEQACHEARIPWEEAQQRCQGLDSPGDDAFYRACLIEYCVSGGDDSGSLVKMASGGV